jgi:hypothetical protein
MAIRRDAGSVKSEILEGNDPVGQCDDSHEAESPDIPAKGDARGGSLRE